MNLHSGKIIDRGFPDRLGGRGLVEKAFAQRRSWFGPKRKTGAPGLPVEGASLFSLRDLKVRALE